MRVAIIGLGAVGEACAHLLASRGTARRLVLANRRRDVAEAIRLDLEQSCSGVTSLNARAIWPWLSHGDVFRGCDVLVLTAGPRLRGDESRASKAQQTARLLEGTPGQSIVESLARTSACAREKGSPSPILLVVTNPVEATVTWLAQRTSWERSRIIGLGTTVETARFSRLLAEELYVDASSVWTEIIGEHGEHIKVADVDAMQRRAQTMGAKNVDVEKLLAATRASAANIRKLSESMGLQAAERLIAKLTVLDGVILPAPARDQFLRELAASLSPPATRFAIAASVLEVIEAVSDDRGRVLPVSGFHTVEGLPEVALALPFVIGALGLSPCASVQACEVLQSAAQSIQDQVDSMLSVTR